jgi:hypothetical protein
LLISLFCSSSSLLLAASRGGAAKVDQLQASVDITVAITQEDGAGLFHPIALCKACPDDVDHSKSLFLCKVTLCFQT